MQKRIADYYCCVILNIVKHGSTHKSRGGGIIKACQQTNYLNIASVCDSMPIHIVCKFLAETVWLKELEHRVFLVGKYLSKNIIQTWVSEKKCDVECLTFTTVMQNAWTLR